MSKPSTIARSALAAVAGVMALSALAAPQMAAAQPYGYSGQGGYGDSYYDPCRRSQSNRSVVGGLLGAGIGATVGSQMAARGHRTDGSVLGGALGAVAGAVVGNKTAACDSSSQYYGSQSYGSQYRAPPPPPPPPEAYYDRGYAPAQYGSRHDDDDRWAYGRGGERFRIAEREVGADGCTLAESPIYLPDGRVQKRFVRVCQDSSGRYQVVD
ncbi:glycine zipper 2TM domain-containing protein [Phenylobacterium sp. LjRoot225]|uniref:glycine zipper 2TM domain-containing protein n=1 Tax=Phenylobacterium sp. LjRoot225 TaxID=3342285 RepID=UPI003ED14EBD